MLPSPKLFLKAHCPRARQFRAAGTPAAAVAQPERMPLLLHPQGLPHPGQSKDEAEGAPEDFYGVKEARRYHKNPIVAWTTKESLGPPALPKLHLVQSTHLQATSLTYMCSSTCSSTGIGNASPPPPFQGWLWSSSFQRLPYLTGCWLCCCDFQPSSLQPSGGKMVAAQYIQHHCPTPLWAGTYHHSWGMWVCSCSRSCFPCRRLDSPKIQVRSSPKILVTGDGLELATCYAQPRRRLMLLK